MIVFFETWFTVFFFIFSTTLTVNAFAIVIDFFDDFVGMKTNQGIMMLAISSAFISFILALCFQWQMK